MEKLYSGDTFGFDTDAPNGLAAQYGLVRDHVLLVRKRTRKPESMTKETCARWSIAQENIFQKVDELDKNHRDLNTGAVSQGRMLRFNVLGLYYISFLQILCRKF